MYYVRDNGVGIERKHLERVFGLFDKLEPASDGTGIGLAVVRRIVEAHRGRAWAESEGRRTRVHVLLHAPRGLRRVSMVGKTLAHYRITAALGAGGMGEVYRATDTKLGRDVALKLLPEAFAADPERLARFEREAKVLASLNHPGIAHLYGFESVPLDGGARPTCWSWSWPKARSSASA